jgi:diguanylate cyclase (GGDEF)-like protein
VGRAAAFADLRAAWKAARDGRPAVALVTGEEGSGKTRFTDEFLRWVEADQPEALVLRARAYEPERETPWSVARELLAPLRAAPGLGGADAGALAHLARLVPGVRERYRELPDAGDDEHRLHEAVLQVILSVAAEVPVVLAVDDLPLADAPSRRLAIFLARRLGGASVLLLYTVRTGDAAAHATTLELRDLPALRRIALKPLRPAEVEAMLRSMLPLPAQECRELAARLHSETGGNPLYIFELSAALVEAGHIEPGEDGRWRLSVSLLGPLPLPAGMRDVVARRLGRLSGAARDTLAAAAALGERFDAARLAAAGELAPRELSDALDELVTRRLLRDTPGRPGNYTFSHSIIRRVAYERLLPARSAAPPPEPAGPRRPWYRKLWQTPDAVFVDAGSAGEWLTARLRLAVMALLLILPTVNLLTEPSYGPYRTGFVVTLLAVAVAVILLQLLRRDGYRPWLGFLSSGLDVSLVSLGLASFIWAGDPHAAVNSKTTFEIYFLAVLAASLRYDRRICISAGAIAIAQYLAIVAYADARWELNDPGFAPFPYGMFSWVAQIGRAILLGAAALLSWELVRRAQHLREMAVRDQVTGLFNRNFFETRARVELARARRYGYDVAVALLEIPAPPRTGERFGHDAGDERLRSLAERIRGVLREGDVIARYGIGEIALLLPEANADEAARTLDFLRADLGCGVAGFPADGGHLEILMQVAGSRAWTAHYAREAASPAPRAAASA